MGHFAKSRLAEYLACVMMSLGLCYAIYAGFVLDDSFYTSYPLTFIAVFAVTAIMYLLSYNRITVGIGIGLGVIGTAAVIIIMKNTEPWNNEEESSTFIFWLITILVSVIIFLVTRSRLGCVIGIILSNLIFAGSYFLDFPVKLWQYILLVFGGVLLFLLRVYMISALRATTGRIHILKYFVQSIIVALSAVLLSVGVFYAVIRPLNPPTKEIQILTVLRNMEIFQVFGVAETREVYDPDKWTGDEQQEMDADNPGEQENQRPDGEDEDPQAVNDPKTKEDSQNTSLADSIVNSELFQDLQAIAYDLTGAKLYLLIAIIALAIIEVFLIRQVLKLRWRRAVQSLRREDGVLNYFHFFTKRFRRVGYKKPENYTLVQYAQMMEHQLEPYTTDGVTFAELTRIYSRVYYGGAEVTDEEWRRYEIFYDSFHRNLRRDIGTPKYLLKLFLI